MEEEEKAQLGTHICVRPFFCRRKVSLLHVCANCMQKMPDFGKRSDALLLQSMASFRIISVNGIVCLFVCVPFCPCD